MPIMYGIGVDDNAINKMQNKYGIASPEDYMPFLKKYNGFIIKSPDYCDIFYQKVSNVFISFDALFGLNFSNEDFDLYEINNNYLDELSLVTGAFIIGAGPGVISMF